MQHTLKNFHYLVGETLMFCQFIEHDLKFIYSLMLKGKFEENLVEIDNDTFGKWSKN